MSEPQLFVTRPEKVRAMQFHQGVTTKSQIRAFCPHANIGIRYDRNQQPVEDDVRWVYVAPVAGEDVGRREVQFDGDWLVQRTDGLFFVLEDQEFNRRYQKP
jgi:hypothetical protein